MGCPCHGCADRWVNDGKTCHGECNRYLEWNAENQKRLQDKYNRYLLDEDIKASKRCVKKYMDNLRRKA